MGLRLESTYMADCLEIGAREFDWQKKREARTVARAPGRRQRQDQTRVRPGHHEPLHRSRSPLPRTLQRHGKVQRGRLGGPDRPSRAPVGQHIWGALSQICAEELGIRAEDVHIIGDNTDITLFEYGSDASRSTYAVGGATLRASRQAKEQLLTWAAKMLEVPADELYLKDRTVHCTSDPAKQLPMGDVCFDAIYRFDGRATNFFGKQSF